MSKVVIIGAGKTGRGFLARLLKDQQIYLIDRDAALVDQLHQSRLIPIDFFGGRVPSVTVPIADAFTWQTLDPSIFTDCDVILVSVGGTNLANVGQQLKPFVNAHSHIIVCENASQPAKKLADAIGVDQLHIAESTVFCTTIEKEPGSVAINSEWYPYLQFDGNAFPVLDWVPQGLKPVQNFGGFLDRKLYTYNSASCIIAYLGAYKGYRVYGDAANDPQILSLLDQNYASVNACICQEYGYEEQDQQEFALLSRNKFTDRTLVDTVARNAREPQRKLTHAERIVAPLLLEQKYGKDTSVLEKTLAAALLYTPEEEVQWRAILQEKGYVGVLTQICGLTCDNPVYGRILEMVSTGHIL